MRPTSPTWACQRSGDCCLQTALTVTPQELSAMQAATAIRFDTEVDGAFVRVLTPRGCPALRRELDGRAVCSIYEARPYQCRRFMCLRPDPTTEPFELGGPLGCRNLSDRLHDSGYALTLYATNQRRAQRWARDHGWTNAMTTA